MLINVGIRQFLGSCNLDLNKIHYEIMQNIDNLFCIYYIDRPDVNYAR